MKLFVVTHKVVQNIPDDRTLIGVGPNRSIKGVGLYDNTGDNIAQKNANYCELTALYWMWKNVDEDYIGLEHYRRLFCKKTIFKAVPLSEKRIKKILSKYQIILPRRTKAKRGIYGNYVFKHIKSDMDVCLDIIKTDMPEYSEALDKAMALKRETVCNMFVMPKNLANEYCEWLFKILFKAEGRIDLSGYDDYEKRIFGFLSERLFNVWLYQKKLKTYYAPIYGVDTSPIINKLRGLKRRIKALIKNG